jgi:hypothetical protein
MINEPPASHRRRHRDEVAALVAHLASPEAGFTTGRVIGIHEGTVLARS